MNRIITTIAAAMAVFTLSPAWGTEIPDLDCYGEDYNDLVCVASVGLDNANRLDANRSWLRGIHDEQHLFEVRRLRHGAIDQAMTGLTQEPYDGAVFGAGVGEVGNRQAVAVGGSFGWGTERNDFVFHVAAGFAGDNTTKARAAIIWRP